MRPRFALYCGLALLVLLGVFLRFYLLDLRGVSGSDTLYYTNISKSWSEGARSFGIDDQRRVYRPVPFFLFGSAVRLVGFTDYSIKLLNAWVDTLNVVLLFLICRLLARDTTAAGCAAATYALLPMAIQASRVELVHVISAATVLLSFTCFLLYVRSARPWMGRVFIGGSGVFVGLSVLTHEELIFLVVPYLTLCLLIPVSSLPASSVRRRAENVVVSTTIFLGAVFVTCHQSITFNRQTGLQVVRAGTARTFSESNLLYKAGRFLGDSLVVNSSLLLLGLFLAVSLLLAWRVVRRRQYQSANPQPAIIALAPALIVLGHVAVCALVFDRYFARLFLPLVPLVLAGVFGGLALLAPERRRSLVVVGTTLLLLPANLAGYGTDRRAPVVDLRPDRIAEPLPVQLDLRQGLGYFLRGNYAPTWPRRIFDALQHRVGPDTRILVTPAILYPYPGRRVYQMGFYFGDSAVYVADHDEPLEDLIARRRIRYVLFTTFGIDERLLDRRRYRRLLDDGKWETVDGHVLGQVYGFERGEYTLQKEWDELRWLLARRGARAIGSSFFGRVEDLHRVSADELLYVLFELPPPVPSEVTPESAPSGAGS